MNGVGLFFLVPDPAWLPYWMGHALELPGELNFARMIAITSFDCRAILRTSFGHTTVARCSRTSESFHFGQMVSGANHIVCPIDSEDEHYLDTDA